MEAESKKFPFPVPDMRIWPAHSNMVLTIFEMSSTAPVHARQRCESRYVPVVRKFLETFGIFIGSHVLSIGPAEIGDRVTIDKLIKKLIAAPNGGYTIAEEADRSEVRIS